MKPANVKQADSYLSKAREWIKTTQGIWNNNKYCATTSVAEYLANQDGLTLYPTARQASVTQLAE